MFRYSSQPSKQLLWLFLMRDMRLSRGSLVGIDAGSGAMLNRGFFRSGRYVAIDGDGGRLERGRARYSEAVVFRGLIEEAPFSGDFVLCVQVLVSKLATSLTMPVVRALVGMVVMGGTLIFNISRANLVYEAEIDGLLADSFRDVRKRRYGALMGYDGVFGSIIGFLMFLVPVLRYGGEYRKVYYLCRDRYYRCR